MPRKYEPDRHCGAQKKNGQPCTQPKGFGTSHSGEGYCHLHEVQEPIKIEPSKKPQPEAAIVSTPTPIAPTHHLQGKQNALKHGLYSKVLTGNAKVRYQAVKEYAPCEILKDGFYLVHSRVLGLLEGEGKFDRESQVLLDAAGILAESGELSEDFVAELKLRLLNLDLAKLAGILNSTTALANAAVFLDRMGSIQSQNALLMDFLKNILRGGNKESRELALHTLQLLKLEHGLPVDELSAILQEIKVKAKAEEDGEPEPVLESEEEAIDVEVSDSDEAGDRVKDEWDD